MFVSKSKYEEQLRAREFAEQELLRCGEQLSELRDTLKERDEKIEFLNKKLADCQELLMKTEDRNQVTILISDDMTNIEPVIKFKETANDYLMKIDYVNGTSDHETQIGLMLVAQEGLTQIVESFTERLRDD